MGEAGGLIEDASGGESGTSGKWREKRDRQRQVEERIGGDKWRCKRRGLIEGACGGGRWIDQM